MFAPGLWGRFKKGFSGVHYTFAYRQEATGPEYVRLSLGVEKPLKNEFKKDFKIEIVNNIKSKGLHLPDEFDLWPEAGIHKGTKLIETRIVMNDQAWKETLLRYSILDDFNLLVANVIKRYNNEGRFTEKLVFS